MFEEGECKSGTAKWREATSLSLREAMVPPSFSSAVCVLVWGHVITALA